MRRTFQRSDELCVVAALGSIRGLTDSSGTLTGTTSYDAFGAVRSQTGASLALGFAGQLTDPTTGFVDLRARQLDPTLGRFLSADTMQPNAPSTQGYNLYAYVANNPATSIGPQPPARSLAARRMKPGILSSP